MPWRFWRYWGELYDTNTRPFPSSETRTLSGRSIARVGAATMSWVPPFGFPKMSNRVGLITRPTLAASPPKSMRAKTVSPRDETRDSRRSRVSSKGSMLTT